MFSYLIALLVLWVSVAFMLMALMKGWKFASKTKFTHRAIIGTVFLFAIFKVVMYYGLPLFLRMTSGFRYVIEDGYRVSDLAVLYMIEAVSWVPWILGFLLVAAIWRNRQVSSHDDEFIRYRASAGKTFLTLMVIGSIPYRLTSGNYVADVDYGLPMYLEVFKALLSYTGPPAAILILLLGLNRWGRGYAFVGVVGIVTSLATMPTRGALVYSLVFALFCGYYLVRKKRQFISWSALVATAAGVFYITWGGLPQLVLEKGFNGDLYLSTTVNEKKKGDRSAIEEVEWRFGAPSRMSIAFLEMFDRGDEAGINPIKHSLMGLIPRSMNPEKPHPSTVKPYDIYSQGMYLVYRETHGYNTYSMVEFSTGAHAYWEFGFIGVLLLPFIAGLYIGFCAYYFQYFGIASLALMMTVFKPFGYVDPKIWVSDVAMQLYQIILPIGLLVGLWIVVRKLKRFLPRTKRNFVSGFIVRS